jgi:hypothetical protein
MAEFHLAKTANRSLIGMMNEFSYRADAYRDSDNEPDLVDLSLRLAATPCGPLYSSQVFPEKEPLALVARQSER